MKDLVCYIPIEVLSRELDYKIYLALKLLAQGYKIVIGKINSTFTCIKTKKSVHYF